MLKINGVVVESPAGLEVTYSVLDKYAERTENGKLNREIAAKKLKYQLNWNYIPDSSAFRKLWNTFANLGEFAKFTLPHPNGTNNYTFEGYIGDMGVTMQSYWDMGQGQQSKWKSFKVNIIER